MKKILMAAVALTALGATPAMAATTSTYTVTGNVGALCSANATGTIAFGNLVNDSGVLNAQTTSAEPDTSAYCNGVSTTVQVAHTNLKKKNYTDTPPSGFVSVVSFTPEIVAGSNTLTGDKDAGTPIGAFSGLTVKATSPSVTTGTKPLAGDYEGSITVTLTPTV